MLAAARLVARVARRAPHAPAVSPATAGRAFSASATATSSQDPVRLAVIGAGRMGTLHANNIAGMAQATLAAVYDPDAAAAATVAGATGAAVASAPEALFDGSMGVDGVVIASPAGLHTDHIVSAARAGVHVLCEKPLVLTPEDAETVRAEVSKGGVALQLAFMRRFDTDIRTVRDAVAAGDIGKPHIVRIRSFDGIVQPSKFYATSGGIFQDMASHDFDVAQYLAGAPITAVSAVGGVLVDPGFADFGDVDTSLISLEFANGALGVIELSRFAAYGHDTQVEVHGADGTAGAGPNGANTAFVATASGYKRSVLMPHVSRYEPCFGREMVAFAETVAAAKGGAPVELSPYQATASDGARCINVALAAKRALDERRTVDVEQVDD